MEFLSAIGDTNIRVFLIPFLTSFLAVGLIRMFFDKWSSSALATAVNSVTDRRTKTARSTARPPALAAQDRPRPRTISEILEDMRNPPSFTF